MARRDRYLHLPWKNLCSALRVFRPRWMRIRLRKSEMEAPPMRFIRRTVFLAMLTAGGVVAYSSWSDHSWSLRATAGTLDPERAKQHAESLASRAAEKVGIAADKLGNTMSDSAVTAKIKSKMA